MQPLGRAPDGDEELKKNFLAHELSFRMLTDEESTSTLAVDATENPEDAGDSSTKEGKITRDIRYLIEQINYCRSEDHKFVRHKDFDCHLDRSVLCNSFFISNFDWERQCNLEKDYKKYFPLSEVLAKYVVNPGPKNRLREKTEKFTEVLDLINPNQEASQAPPKAVAQEATRNRKERKENSSFQEVTPSIE
eukprot:GHVP01067212.1.p1 GENE.GHVP01067212.1~~GHVP01067212.1.p1  ORF type:complete len:192 (+),score=33.63 GHVP01067212.1:323-898(+)